MVDLILEIVRATLQIAILAVMIYKLYSTLIQTNAASAVYILFIYIFLLVVSGFLELKVLYSVLKLCGIPLFLIIILVYQADFKHIITQFTSSANVMRKRENMLTNENLTQVVTACFSLANKKRGALIVIRRNDVLRNIIETGTILDCRISSAVLLTIFDHDTALHDGAVIIDNNKVIAAGCYLPLSEQTSIKASLGTRHRAAIGISEETDSVTIVVSEETRSVSVCYGGAIYYDLDIDEVKKMILQLMTYNKEGEI